MGVGHSCYVTFYTIGATRFGHQMDVCMRTHTLIIPKCKECDFSMINCRNEVGIDTRSQNRISPYDVTTGDGGWLIHFLMYQLSNLAFHSLCTCTTAGAQHDSIVPVVHIAVLVQMQEAFVKFRQQLFFFFAR